MLLRAGGWITASGLWSVWKRLYSPVGVTGVQRRAAVALKQLFCAVDPLFHRGVFGICRCWRTPSKTEDLQSMLFQICVFFRSELLITWWLEEEFWSYFLCSMPEPGPSGSWPEWQFGERWSQSAVPVWLLFQWGDKMGNQGRRPKSLIFFVIVLKITESSGTEWGRKDLSSAEQLSLRLRMHLGTNTSGSSTSGVCSSYLWK